MTVKEFALIFADRAALFVLMVTACVVANWLDRWWVLRSLDAHPWPWKV